MERHPDTETLAAFREHRLAGSAVVEVAAHVGQCAQCAKPVRGRAMLDALVEQQHLTDAELDAVVDGDANPGVERHLSMCAMCRAEVEDLREYLGVPRSSSGFLGETASRRGTRGTEEPEERNRWWLVAAIAAFAVIALAIIALRFQPAAQVTGVAGSQPAKVDGLRARRSIPPRVVATLADGNQQIALLENGTISGVQPRTPRDEEDARAVMSGKTIAIPTFIAAMPGVVRGGETRTHPPRAIEPFRTAVATAKPRFSWTPVPDAKGYRVAVFDADYEEVARSESLQGTSWTPSKPLPAGVDLSWHVVAETDAGEISSAGSGRTEAVFRVLGSDEAAEVDTGEAHYRDSHLLRGLLYSRHGLLHDAEREFRQLAEQNPGSPIPRALLKSVSR